MRTTPATALERFFASASLKPGALVAVGLSGGRDSVALFTALADWVREHPERSLRVIGFSVHHGLSPHADAWCDFCSALGDRYHVPVEVLHVTVRPEGDGLENAARRARYTALVAAMRRTGASMLLTAHHRNDLLETFLMQWVRGAGVEGLAAMPPISTLAAWGAPDLRLGRPFLSLSRDDITTYVTKRGLSWVEDESNTDERYTRNRMRKLVFPVLEEAFPDFAAPAARSVAWCAEAADVVEERAREDLAIALRPDGRLDLRILEERSISRVRRKNVLRLWFHQTFGVAAESRLVEELLAHLHAGGTVERARVVENRVLHVHHGAVYLRPLERTALGEIRVTPRLGKIWTSEDDRLSLSLQTARADDPDALSLIRLQATTLTIGPRTGADRVHLGIGRPGRRLKDLWAEADVPSFDRPYLPVVRSDGILLFVPPFGTDPIAAQALRDEGPYVHFVWDFQSGSEGGSEVPDTTFGEVRRDA